MRGLGQGRGRLHDLVEKIVAFFFQRIALAAFAFALFAGGGALAQQSCQEDFQKLSVKRMGAIQAFLRQGTDEFTPMAETVERLRELAR